MTTDTNYSTKHSVKENFSQAASYYDEHAEVQRGIADRLIASLRPWIDILPEGPILEVGCGTGFVTQGLIELLPDRELEITDISPEMLETCRGKYGGYKNTTFRTLDAEEFDADPETYAMTVNGFVAQWFKHPAITVGKFLEATKPGGLLLGSFPGNESFPEWKEACRELGLPYTGNELPDTEEILIKLSGGPVQVDYYEDTVTQQFDSAADFFRHIKKVGAGTQQQGRHLSPKELQLLINHWDEKSDGNIQVSYHVVFIAVKRNFDS
ncbi:methyltransferase domain-containing protein [Aliifodinibius sp. S!AR15-10]|uniref:methyltransferase domain-containing protein n=1 Tax=Aliifodinibius sp. S!AR15-10 TaxID=2950437 RepID=UPI00285B5585|nr:methyltransferase domain-containing protein [Aliifodinibius sp. S!AR15-10]MDR8392326.1 methyltransferase domain-containing protein [Aliifodinibius sp. S!AR15-10]